MLDNYRNRVYEACGSVPTQYEFTSDKGIVCRGCRKSTSSMTHTLVIQTFRAPMTNESIAVKVQDNSNPSIASSCTFAPLTRNFDLSFASNANSKTGAAASLTFTFATLTTSLQYFVFHSLKLESPSTCSATSGGTCTAKNSGDKLIITFTGDTGAVDSVQVTLSNVVYPKTMNGRTLHAARGDYEDKFFASASQKLRPASVSSVKYKPSMNDSSACSNAIYEFGFESPVDIRNSDITLAYKGIETLTVNSVCRAIITSGTDCTTSTVTYSSSNIKFAFTGCTAAVSGASTKIRLTSLRNWRRNKYSFYFEGSIFCPDDDTNTLANCLSLTAEENFIISGGVGTAWLTVDSSTSKINEYGIYTRESGPCDRTEIEYYQITATSSTLFGVGSLCDSSLGTTCSYRNSSTKEYITLGTSYTFAMANPHMTYKFADLTATITGLQIKGYVGTEESVNFQTIVFKGSANQYLSGTLGVSNAGSDNSSCLAFANYEFSITINQKIDTTTAIKLEPYDALDTDPSSCNRVENLDYNGAIITTATVTATRSYVLVGRIFVTSANTGVVKFVLPNIKNPSYKGEFRWQASLVFGELANGHYGNTVITTATSVNTHYITSGTLNLLNETNTVRSNYSFELTYPLTLPSTGLSSDQYSVSVELPSGFGCLASTFVAENSNQMVLGGQSSLGANGFVAGITFKSGVQYNTVFKLLIECLNPRTTEPFEARVYLYYDPTGKKYTTNEMTTLWLVEGKTSIGAPFTSLVADPSSFIPGSLINKLTITFKRQSFTQPLTSLSVTLTYTGDTEITMTVLERSLTFNRNSLRRTIEFQGTEGQAESFLLTFTGITSGQKIDNLFAVNIKTYIEGTKYTVDEDNVVISPQCNYPCLTCTANLPDQCLSCPDPLVLHLEDLICVKSYIKCPQGSISDSENSTCLSCHRTCAHCSGTAANECTRCDVDNRLRLRFFHNKECLLTCPKDYTHNYKDYLCEPMEREVYELPELYLCVIWIAGACALSAITVFAGKSGKTSVFCAFYSLLSLAEFLTRVTLFVDLFLDLRHVPNVAISLTIVLMTHTMFWSYKHFQFNPMAKMKSFMPYYEAHKKSIIVIQVLSAFAGSNVMLLLGSGLLGISALSQGMNNHLIYRVFSYKASWAPAVFSVCQAILAFVNLFLYYRKSPVFCVSVMSCATSVALVLFYIAETCTIKTMKKSLDHLTFKAIERKEAKMESEIQRARLLRPDTKS
eukprot:TRINITY_DN6376_c0_g2_i2.p1 TRINITY_DN6376_c0_g2~~TRINITY_DN6376_c0_g2_i2.p1  ORF type:complete len:1231 (-),score=225.15 TRINITY_DN6376_c0_g2_i2:117-3809(-)